MSPRWRPPKESPCAVGRWGTLPSRPTMGCALREVEDVQFTVAIPVPNHRMLPKTGFSGVPTHPRCPDCPQWRRAFGQREMEVYTHAALPHTIWPPWATLNQPSSHLTRLLCPDGRPRPFPTSMMWHRRRPRSQRAAKKFSYFGVKSANRYATKLGGAVTLKALSTRGTHQRPLWHSSCHSQRPLAAWASVVTDSDNHLSNWRPHG